MNAIKIKTHINSQSVNLPHLKPFIGKDVEITVRIAEKGKAMPAKKAARKREKTLDEIAAEQGFKPIKDFSELLGGWPKEELNDGFEEELNRRRKSELVKEPDLD